MSEARIPCSAHPKWDWPHCGAEPADPKFDGSKRWIDPGPDALIPPPEALIGGFTDAPELAQMLRHLVGALPEMNWLAGYDVRALWKAKGGDHLGRCVLATDLVKFYSGAHWIIWVAADHTLGHALTRQQVQALLYHELKHCVLKGAGQRPGIQKHDSEVFIGEVVRFGAWRPELEQLEVAFKLFDAEARTRIEALIEAAHDVTP
jgi:hypothetical protein